MTNTLFLFLAMGAPQGEGSSTMNMIFLGSIFVIMYLFMIRPQVKKAKEQKNFIEALKKGDEVLTSGGLYGKISHINESDVQLEIAPNIKIKVDKNSISVAPSPTDKKK